MFDFENPEVIRNEGEERWPGLRSHFSLFPALFPRSYFGQWFAGIRVRSYRTGKRPSLFESYLRYFYKIGIGWKSLLFYSKEYERLIHDNVAGTIVVMQHSSSR